MKLNMMFLLLLLMMMMMMTTVMMTTKATTTMMMMMMMMMRRMRMMILMMRTATIIVSIPLLVPTQQSVLIGLRVGWLASVEGLSRHFPELLPASCSMWSVRELRSLH